MDGVPCYNDRYLRSINPIPDLLIGGCDIIAGDEFNNILVTHVNSSRFKYVGHNKWLASIIYCTTGSDKRLYFKGNDLHHYLQKVTVSGVFEDAESIAE